MKLLLSIALAVFLVGCASTVNTKPKKEIVVSSPPVCSSEAECSEMWNKAIEQIQMISGMKLRILTDSYAETFTPRQSSRPTGSVVKTLNSDGTTTIKGNFNCGYSHCRDIEASAENLFNIMVKPVISK